MSKQINDPRMGNNLNYFVVEGLVQYGFRRDVTATKKSPYLVFLIQQKFNTKTGKVFTRGFQVMAFVDEIVDELTTLTNQVYLRVEGNVIVDYFVTKEGKKVTKVKLLANKVEILEELATRFVDKGNRNQDEELDNKLKELK
jgi:hypothetical protein